MNEHGVLVPDLAVPVDTDVDETVTLPTGERARITGTPGGIQILRSRPLQDSECQDAIITPKSVGLRSHLEE